MKAVNKTDWIQGEGVENRRQHFTVAFQKWPVTHKGILQQEVWDYFSTQNSLFKSFIIIRTTGPSVLQYVLSSPNSSPPEAHYFIKIFPPTYTCTELHREPAAGKHKRSGKSSAWFYTLTLKKSNFTQGLNSKNNFQDFISFLTGTNLFDNLHIEPNKTDFLWLVRRTPRLPTKSLRRRSLMCLVSLLITNSSLSNSFTLD